MLTEQSKKAIAYLRTSSAANVGADKDSDKRQRAAIEAFAKRDRWEVVEEFYDADVSGADPIESRPGFSALLDRIEGNGVSPHSPSKSLILLSGSQYFRYKSWC
jgi:DNA invertase Pin-like site-specific DNA recombinase